MKTTANSRTPSLTLRTALLAAFCNVLWAGAYISGKYLIGTPASPGFGPMRAAFLRFAISGAVLWLYLRATKPERLVVQRADYVPMAFIGIFGITLTYLLNYAGLARSAATAAALILSTEPVWVILLAVLFLRERMTLAKAAGIVLGLGGAFLVVLSTGSTTEASAKTALIGNALIVASLLVESCGILVIKRLASRYSGFTITVWQFLIGSACLLPFAVGEHLRVGWQTPSPAAWLALGYLVIACTITAYTLWFVLLEKADASRLSIFLFLQARYRRDFGRVSPARCLYRRDGGRIALHFGRCRIHPARRIADRCVSV